QIGSGVILVNGIDGPYIPARPLADAFPGVVGSAAWTAALLALLFLTGLGWTWAMLGPGAPPAVVAGSAPAVGAGAMILVGTVVSRAGAGLGGSAGVTTLMAVAVAGFGAAALRRQRR